MKAAGIRLYRGGITGYRKIKAFLFSKANKEFLIFLLFFVISSVFWLLKTLDEEYEQEFNIPVRMVNMPENAVLTTDVPSTVRVTLKDKGIVLLRYMYATHFQPIVINYKDYAPDNMDISISGIDLRRKITSVLASSTRITALRPDGLDISYIIGEGKRVPVRFNGDVRVDAPYFLSHVKCWPDSVTVYADPGRLAQITSVNTDRLLYRNFKDTTFCSVPLAHIEGVKLVPSQVKVGLYPDMYTEKTVEVPIVGVNFPAGKLLKTFPSKVSVTFQVGLNQFKRITGDDFICTVTYESLLYTMTSNFKVVLKSVPQGVRHIKISPAYVDFLIEQVDTDVDSATGNESE